MKKHYKKCMEKRFEANIIKNGDCYRVTIPKKLFRFFKLKLGNCYEFIIKREIKEK